MCITYRGGDDAEGGLGHDGGLLGGEGGGGASAELHLKKVDKEKKNIWEEQFLAERPRVDERLIFSPKVCRSMMFWKRSRRSERDRCDYSIARIDGTSIHTLYLTRIAPKRMFPSVYPTRPFRLVFRSFGSQPPRTFHPQCRGG